MSTADPSKILAGVPGRLAFRTGADFSTFSVGRNGFPFGGTELGKFKGALLTRTNGTYEVRAEEWAGEVVEEIEGREDWVVTCLFRSRDPDAVRLVWPNVVIGAVTGQPISQSSGGTATPLGVGEPRSKRWSGGLRVLFMPDDDVNHDAVYLRSAIARTAREVEFPLALRQEATILATFRALRPATGAACRWGRLADL